MFVGSVFLVWFLSGKGRRASKDHSDNLLNDSFIYKKVFKIKKRKRKYRLVRITI